MEKQSKRVPPEIILIKDYRLTSEEQRPTKEVLNKERPDLARIQRVIEELSSRISNVENYLSSNAC